MSFQITFQKYSSRKLLLLVFLAVFCFYPTSDVGFKFDSKYNQKPFADLDFEQEF